MNSIWLSAILWRHLATIKLIFYKDLNNSNKTCNMTAITKTRIESIDLLKGLVMVIMALDDVRDYFHYYAFMFDPAEPTLSTLPIFFTRWLTHFCAPAFSFLAGLSAFMVGQRKTQNELLVFY